MHFNIREMHKSLICIWILMAYEYYFLRVRDLYSTYYILYSQATYTLHQTTDRKGNAKREKEKKLPTQCDIIKPLPNTH